MTLAAKLLPKLKSQGKKVLIFSQFTIVLDLLEDYLHEMSYEFERLDGSTSQADRQAGIDRFNRDGSGFVYLLSTRAGGMGITLTAADTAVIYDSDWNPQNDLQAMARCHRIGQTKEVKVYRLVTKATYEQSLFETSAKKYGLDEAVLGGGDGADGGAGAKSAKEDAAKINRLLKYGVHGALRDSSGEEAAAFEKEDIDQILGKRAEHRAIGARAGNTFSTAVFSAAGEEEDFDAEDFWAKALPEATKVARDAETAFGQGRAARPGRPLPRDWSAQAQGHVRLVQGGRGWDGWQKNETAPRRRRRLLGGRRRLLGGRRRRPRDARREARF